MHYRIWLDIGYVFARIVLRGRTQLSSSLDVDVVVAAADADDDAQRLELL